MIATITIVPLDQHGVMVLGHDHDPDVLMLNLKSWLVIHRSMTRLAAHNMVALPGAVQEAWWGGDKYGFVGEGHPAAKPVTIMAFEGGA